MEKGYLCFVLHAHLPFIRHPEHKDFMEEDWLFEAITETYLPLIEIFDRLVEEHIDFRLTLSLTPPLCAMLSDSLLRERYLRYLYKLIELSEREVKRLQWVPELCNVAQMYEKKFKTARYIFEDKYHRDVLSAFKKFQDMGKVEIITGCATHGILPLMVNQKAKEAQVKVAVRDYEMRFGRKPRGIWLSECAYGPGIDEVLKEEGIKFFFTDTHGVMYGKPRPKYGVFSPVFCPSGVAAFARDTESSHQVWSANTGYPGDFRYREFYRDLGYDADYEYIRPHLQSNGIRKNIGIKYYKITGQVPLYDKKPYCPQDALDAAAAHAGNFMFNRGKQLESLNDLMGKKPIIVSPYDAELFGHWWYEGPAFIDFLFRKIHYDQKTIRLITPIEYLRENPKNQVVTPSMSTWGDKGYNECWLNGSNDWIYRHLHKAAERMIEVSRENPQAKGIKEQALNQAARELLLAQSSDWAFIMTTGTVVSYAQKKTKEHLNRFTRLYNDIKQDKIDKDWLSDIEYKDNIFPWMDYTVYR